MRQRETDGAPNRLINWINWRKTLNSQLGPCRRCKSNGHSIDQTQNVSFTTTFEIVHRTCNAKKEKERLEIVYMDKNEVNGCDKEERDY